MADQDAVDFNNKVASFIVEVKLFSMFISSCEFVTSLIDDMMSSQLPLPQQTVVSASDLLSKLNDFVTLNSALSLKHSYSKSGNSDKSSLASLYSSCNSILDEASDQLLIECSTVKESESVSESQNLSSRRCFATQTDNFEESSLLSEVTAPNGPTQSESNKSKRFRKRKKKSLSVRVDEAQPSSFLGSDSNSDQSSNQLLIDHSAPEVGESLSDCENYVHCGCFDLRNEDSIEAAISSEHLKANGPTHGGDGNNMKITAYLSKSANENLNHASPGNKPAASKNVPRICVNSDSDIKNSSRKNFENKKFPAGDSELLQAHLKVFLKIVERNLQFVKWNVKLKSAYCADCNRGFTVSSSWVEHASNVSLHGQKLSEFKCEICEITVLACNDHISDLLFKVDQHKDLDSRVLSFLLN